MEAKAKKLTLESRKGNDEKIKSDFAQAVQKAYDQGLSSAKVIVDGGVDLIDSDGNVITLPSEIKEVYIFNLLSEHYPSLAFQCGLYLKYNTTDKIRAPIVMDVFFLDTLTEMLDTPLRLLSYVDLRIKAMDKLHVSHEIVALGFHLTENLWLDQNCDICSLEDSCSMDIDAAMMVRRDGVSGERTPPGILTKYAGTLFETLIKQLEYRADPFSLAFGLVLLQMREDTCKKIHLGLEAITKKTRIDGEVHDFTIAINGDIGICFHCNRLSTHKSEQNLTNYCEMRKYTIKASRFYGVSLDPCLNVQFGLMLNFPWEQSDDMERVVHGMKSPSPISLINHFAREVRHEKVGRNDPCPCGSGIKYKKCHLGR